MLKKEESFIGQKEIEKVMFFYRIGTFTASAKLIITKVLICIWENDQLPNSSE